MKLAIYGTGGMAREVYDFAVSLNKWDSFVFINDYEDEGEFKSWPRMTYAMFKERFLADECQMIIAQGEPEAKGILLERIKSDGYHLASLISPESKISPSAKIGEGVIIYQDVVISADSEIGDNTTLNSHIVIAHDVKIGKNSQFGSFTVVAGHAEIGENTYVGIHCAVRDRVKIGRDSILSMGAIVLKSVPEEAIVMGNPARVIDKNIEHKVFK